MTLALFDLDHTLLDGDSNSLWLAHLAAAGRVPAETLSLQDAFMARYAAGTLDIGEYFEFNLGLLAGRPLEDWLALRADFVAQVIAPRIGPAAHAAIAGHRARGDRIAIVTATHSFLSAPVGALLDLPVIAPQAELQDGRLSGRISGPICFGEGKLLCVARWLEAEGLQPTQRTFYSDSANDLPLLEAVSHPVAVNADPRLAAVAQARGWPMLSWAC